MILKVLTKISAKLSPLPLLNFLRCQIFPFTFIELPFGIIKFVHNFIHLLFANFLFILSMSIIKDLDFTFEFSIFLHFFNLTMEGVINILGVVIEDLVKLFFYQHLPLHWWHLSLDVLVLYLFCSRDFPLSQEVIVQNLRVLCWKLCGLVVTLLNKQGNTWITLKMCSPKYTGGLSLIPPAYIFDSGIGYYWIVYWVFSCCDWTWMLGLLPLGRLNVAWCEPEIISAISDLEFPYPWDSLSNFMEYSSILSLMLD